MSLWMCIFSWVYSSMYIFFHVNIPIWFLPCFFFLFLYIFSIYISPLYQERLFFIYMFLHVFIFLWVCSSIYIFLHVHVSTRFSPCFLFFFVYISSIYISSLYQEELFLFLFECLLAVTFTGEIFILQRIFG